MNPMNCEDTIERLPWLLNGSLEPEERAALLLHLQGCQSCREALGETRLALDIFSRHLSLEQLVALAADETPEGADLEVLHRHLETCPQCAADLELARMSRRLVTEDKVALMPAGRRKTAGRASWWPAALAAGLMAVVMGGGWLTTFQKAGRLSDQLAEQRGQQGGGEGNAMLFTLSAPTVERGEDEPREPGVFPAGMPLTLLIPSRTENPETVAVKIFDAHDGLFLKQDPLTFQRSLRVYTLNLGSRALPPGTYTVRTYRVDGKEWEPIGEYPIKIGS